MSQDLVFSDSCTGVHEFEEKTKFHVPEHESEKTKSCGGGMTPKKNSVLFHFLPTLKTNLIF